MPKRKVVKQDITAEEFYAILERACQPVQKPSESDLSRSKTSESDHPDGYNEKNTH